MNISKAALLSGLTIKAVRYYANIDLVIPNIDPRTGYRDFSNKDIAKLNFIGRARRLDFSVKECRSLIDLYDNKERSSRDVKKIANEKLKEIDERLSSMNLLRNELFSLSQACKGDDRPDCPIINNFSK